MTADKPAKITKGQPTVNLVGWPVENYNALNGVVRSRGFSIYKLYIPVEIVSPAFRNLPETNGNPYSWDPFGAARFAD